MEQDHILIARLNASSKKAFGELFDRYVGIVHSFVSSMIKDESVAEDITQLVFVKLWEQRKNISSEGNLPAWLYVTARNAVFKEIRRMILMDKYVNYAVHSQMLQENNALDGIDGAVLRQEVDSVVNSFPEAMKKIYLLRTVEGLSVADIAKMMDISPKTVETQLFRAKGRLRDKIKKI
ncbi:MAG: RNA polymerase sigma factor [Candidatus Cryptobacteroides sp.]